MLRDIWPCSQSRNNDEAGPTTDKGSPQQKHAALFPILVVLYRQRTIFWLTRFYHHLNTKKVQPGLRLGRDLHDYSQSNLGCSSVWISWAFLESKLAQSWGHAKEISQRSDTSELLLQIDVCRSVRDVKCSNFSSVAGSIHNFGLGFLSGSQGLLSTPCQPLITARDDVFGLAPGNYESWASPSSGQGCVNLG